jgi:hypothetical protein
LSLLNNKIMENVENVKESANYMYIEPNSHFFGDLEQIKHSLELGVSREHIIIGLENTMKKGYNLTQELDCE